jgi:hypothetical protein
MGHLVADSVVKQTTKYIIYDNTFPGIATGYRLAGRGLIPGIGKRLSSIPQHPDRL